MPKTSSSVGRKIRDTRNGNPKMASPAITSANMVRKRVIIALRWLAGTAFMVDRWHTTVVI
jgi:hypothetical protein